MQYIYIQLVNNDVRYEVLHMFLSLSFVHAVVLRKNTKQRAELQPPTFQRNSMSKNNNHYITIIIFTHYINNNIIQELGGESVYNSPGS